jgi:hypothetical protein
LWNKAVIVDIRVKEEWGKKIEEKVTGNEKLKKF